MQESDLSGLPVLDPRVLPRAVGNRQEIISQVVEAYVQTLGDIGAAVEEALDGGDLETLARLAHRIKGGAANLGGKRLSHLAATLEETARAGDLARCRGLAAGLRQEMGELLEVLGKEPWSP